MPNTESRRVAELEAENAALRRALADARAETERAAVRQGAVLAREKAKRATDLAGAREASAEAGARHGREVAASRDGLAASEESNFALRRANAALTESRAALRESQERLRLILDSAADYAIFSMDAERRIASWNAGAERLLGWSEEEALGRSADVIFTPEDREAGEPEREGEGALREGRAADERWHQRKDGTRFWANGLMLPLRDPEAGPASPPPRPVENHARRNGEAAGGGRAARGRGPPPAHGRTQPADTLDRRTGRPHHRLQQAVAGGHRPFPRSGDGRGLDAGAAPGGPGRHGRGLGARGLHRRALRRGSAPPHGGRVPSLVALARLDAEGRIVRWYGTTEDIHDRKEAEERLREGEARWRGLFESRQEGLEVDELVHGPDGRPTDLRYLDVNPAWERHTGIPRDAAVGRLLSEVVPGLDPFWLETYARVVETGEPAHVERFVPQLGRWYEVRVHRTAGTGRFGSLIMDATGRKAAEARRDGLVELGDRLRDLRDPGGIARTAAEVIGRALGASRAGYGPVDEEETLRIEQDWTGGPEVASVAGEWRLPEYWSGFSGDLRRGEVVAIDDVERDPRTEAHAGALLAIGVRAQVVVPMVEAGRVAALLFVHEAAPRDWTAEEVEFIRGAADRAWAAAERARADEALRASESPRRAALTAARLGTWEWDLATDAVALDGRAREMFGFRPGEGGRAPEVFGRIHHEDRARVLAESLAAAGSMSRLETEYRVPLPDGTVRAVASLGDFVPGAGGRAARMLGVFADVTDRKLAEDRRALLVNELNHRVKNTLAVVQSLALQTARGAADLPAFTAAFQARLMALARAHDLLTRKDWQGAPLGDVVRAALQAGGEGRVDIGCGDAAAPLLAPAQALALALALHELLTNALKHGALSAPGGRVSVRCRADPGSGARVVEWPERGGPPIAAAPERRGFGLRLLERGLATQAGMAAELRFEPGGLRCALRLPPPAG